MQLWPPLIRREAAQVSAAARQVGVLEHQVGVAAAQLEHRLLQAGPGPRRHGATRGRAAGEGDGGHLGRGDRSRRRGSTPTSSVRNASRGTPASCRISSIASAQPRHVRGVLEQARVAGHQRRGGEAEHLPEGEVPGHHRQHETERLEGHVAPRGVRSARARAARKRSRVLGVVVAAAGALVGLGAALGQRLAHLERHQARQLVPPLAQQRAGAPQRPRRARRTSSAPRLERRAAAAPSAAATSSGVASSYSRIGSPLAGLTDHSAMASPQRGHPS